MLTLQFARRYLFSRKSHAVINLIAGVSVVAIATPVAAMIILLSVFNGFEGLIRSMASAFDADLTITPREGVLFAEEELQPEGLLALEGVEAAAAILEQQVLVKFNDEQHQITLRGVTPAYSDLFPIRESLVAGLFTLEQEGQPTAIMGQSMAHSLRVGNRIGAPLQLYALGGRSFSTLLPMESYTRREVTLAGIFSLDAQSELNYLIVPRTLVEELCNREGLCSHLQLRLLPDSDPEELREQVEQIVGADFRVQTRYELRPTFYDIMTYEKWGIFFIALLVLILASFSMVGALVMLILDKRDERITLRALGADDGFVRRIFLHEGLLIGALGALLGALLGVGVTLLQQHFGLVKMPVESFVFENYPVELRWGDLGATLLAFAGVVLVGSWLTVRSMIRPETKKKNVNL